MTVLDPLVPLATEIVATCTRLRLQIVTAESCTGGLVAALLTEVPGSSLVVERGLVTYSNAAKTDLLGVPAATIERDGAVSESVARAMAEGALRRSPADIALAVTGIAGPGGGTAEKPVGLVHFATRRRDHETRHARHIFPDLGRSAIRLAAAREALIMLSEAAAL